MLSTYILFSVIIPPLVFKIKIQKSQNYETIVFRNWKIGREENNHWERGNKWGECCHDSAYGMGVSAHSAG